MDIENMDYNYIDNLMKNKTLPTFIQDGILMRIISKGEGMYNNNDVTFRGKFYKIETTPISRGILSQIDYYYEDGYHHQYVINNESL